jgi:hypothetical protein
VSRLRATFVAPLWEYPGTAAWFFVSLPTDVADDVAEIADGPGGVARGFGSVRVEVRVGDTSWATSLFPDKSRGTYLLPVKKAVRTAEGLMPGGPVEVTITVVD